MNARQMSSREFTTLAMIRGEGLPIAVSISSLVERISSRGGYPVAESIACSFVVRSCVATSRRSSAVGRWLDRTWADQDDRHISRFGPACQTQTIRPKAGAAVFRIAIDVLPLNGSKIPLHSGV
jgi:hypothetical protein